MFPVYNIFHHLYISTYAICSISSFRKLQYSRSLIDSQVIMGRGRVDCNSNAIPVLLITFSSIKLSNGLIREGVRP